MGVPRVAEGRATEVSEEAAETPRIRMKRPGGAEAGRSVAMVRDLVRLCDNYRSGWRPKF